MASMLISGLISHLQQPGLMLEMEEQRQKMLDFFIDTQSKLADAKLRAESDPDVATWLSDLNAVANYANILVDDFRYAKLKAEVEAEGCQNGDKVRAGLFSRFKISCINHPFFNKRVNGELQGIRNKKFSVVNRIDGLVERMRALNFQPGEEINITAVGIPQQPIFSCPAEIGDFSFIREESAKSIVYSLVDLIADEVELFVDEPNSIGRNFYIPDWRSIVDFVIQGPRGIGKTVVARFVCNDASINSYFKCVLLVEVGNAFNIGKVLKSIIDHATGKDCCISEGDIELLQLRLYPELWEKRCLIVLDDVWPEDHQTLMEFRRLIAKTGTCRKTIVVITRFDEVARKGHYKNRFTIKPLDLDDGCYLFSKKAFPDEISPLRDIIEQLSCKIVVICQGSPLALNMMGGLMRFKKEPEEWQGVINQLENYIGDGVATIETIIKVCYNNMCSQVKECFAFCSMFQKGHYIDKEVLIKLWIAKGLLPSDGSMLPEERGNVVFNELVSRHFFEDVKLIHQDNLYGNKHGYHSRVTCRMLDLIHEQATIAANNFPQKTPDLYIPSDSQGVTDVFLNTKPAIRIGLFSPPHENGIETINGNGPKGNSLRELQLYYVFLERIVLDLKYATHLRYLDLSRSTIKILPETISSLYLLETLNLSKCLLLYQLPKNMKSMRSLRHLDIHRCPKLKKMPAHLRQLSNLQTLTTYIVGENAGNGIDELKDLHLGGLLELYNLRKVKTAEIAKQADLVSKMNLDRLTLCWGSEQLVMSKENNDLEVLEALQPHIQLKVLKIQQYGGREFPSWLSNPKVMGLENLVELQLIGCSQCETLPAVWKLSYLTVLCLRHMVSLTCISRTNEEDSCKPFFPSLKRMVLIGLKRLERWHEGEAIVTFPVLDEVEISSCPNLKTIPHVPELKHITASIENYKLLKSVTNLITQAKNLVEVHIAKASNVDNEPFPALGEEVEGRVTSKLKKMRLDSTNSLFMPTALPHSLLGLWRPFKFLEYLDIFDCNTLDSWPPEFRYLIFLTRLSIRMCPNLTGVLADQEREYRSLLPNLQTLEFYGCNSLKQIPKCITYSLRVLELDECPKVESVEGIQGLEMLYLSCTSWTSLPSGLGTFDRLGTLWVSECYSLTSLPDELARTDFVKTLVINECPMLKELPGGHEWLSSLEDLQILKCPHLESFSKEEPYSSIRSEIGNRRGGNEEDGYSSN